MSGFAFGFSGDDIDDDDLDGDISGREATSMTRDPGSVLPPRFHTLESLLPSLPSHISFGHISISSAHGKVCLPRREIFDVRAQLMAEDAEENEDLISGLDKGDLKSGVYEGGLKTWECSLDLASLILSNGQNFLSRIIPGKDLHCVELGSGTAIASMALMASYLAKPKNERPSGLHLTICDYNEAVLKLVSLPNLLLAWQASQAGFGEEGEFEIDQGCLKQFTSGLRQHNVKINFISGAWGSQMTQMILNLEESGVSPLRLVLASETIYSPASISSFVQTLEGILYGSEDAQALVAAKKIYFGVGGGVDDFCEHLQERQLGYQAIVDVKDAGVGRVVLSVKQNSS